jgi:hypothetical protein
MALRVAITRHELENVTVEPTATMWLQATLQAMDPNVTGIDIDRARACLSMSV